MTIDDLVALFHDVSGLSEYQAKTCVYYAGATHHLIKFDWFPILAFIGPPSTGKSKAIDVMEKLCFMPHRITCHKSMTSAALRDDLVSSYMRTALIEEVDLHPNKKEVESFLINRVDKVRTSGLPVKEQIEMPNGVMEWRQRAKKVFGATVIHDRYSLSDLATESRAIVINTRRQQGTFIDVPKKLTLPRMSLGSIAQDIPNNGRPFDTWKPLISIASGQNDYEWILWAEERIEEAGNDLKDGQVYEEQLRIFSGVIECYCDGSGLGLLVKEPLAIKLVVDRLQKEMPWLHPKTVARTLRKMGLTVRQSSGTTKLFTTKEKLEKVAKEIGYEDDAL